METIPGEGRAMARRGELCRPAALGDGERGDGTEGAPSFPPPARPPRRHAAWPMTPPWPPSETQPRPCRGPALQSPRALVPWQGGWGMARSAVCDRGGRGAVGAQSIPPRHAYGGLS
eukprot:9477862-Pyramimonas_sp.AAC.1